MKGLPDLKDLTEVVAHLLSACGTYKTVKAGFWPWLSGESRSGRGFARAEDAQGTPAQSHISPRML